MTGRHRAPSVTPMVVIGLALVAVIGAAPVLGALARSEESVLRPQPGVTVTPGPLLEEDPVPELTFTPVP